MSFYIHPTAEVSNKATIGYNTRIWHQAQIREGAKIGEECIIGKGSYVDFDVTIGDRCKLQNGVYVYFRYDAKQTIMCVMNTNDESATIDLSRFAERMNGATKAYDVATGVTFNIEPKLTLGEKYLLVMELKKYVI